MPTLAPLLAAAPAVQLHALAALCALVLAPVILIRRKGGRVHRVLGRIWVAAMALTALSSFTVHEIRLWGDWSPIHLLSLLSLASLAEGMRAAFRRDITRHRKIMENLAFWALGVTGLFTLLPGRVMNHVFFGGESVLGFALSGFLVAALWLAWRGYFHAILGIGIRHGLR